MKHCMYTSADGGAARPARVCIIFCYATCMHCSSLFSDKCTAIAVCATSQSPSFHVAGGCAAETPGSNITMVTYGGSVTAGHLSGSPDGSWVEHLTAWLQTAFPGVTFNVLNLARNSTDNVAAATCWAQYAPADADLVVVEYSVNNCNYNTCTGITQQLVRVYTFTAGSSSTAEESCSIQCFCVFSHMFIEPCNTEDFQCALLSRAAAWHTATQ